MASSSGAPAGNSWRSFHHKLEVMLMSKQINRLDRIRGHKLLTEELRQQLPALTTTDGQGDEALAVVKYFTPDSNWYWYGVEFDGDDLFFGLVFGLEVEMGYFSLAELASLTGPWGLPVERDCGFVPTALKTIRQEHCQRDGRF